MRVCLALLVTLVLAVVGAPAAHAQGCQGAPGTSAVDQYCESAPSADGRGGDSGSGSGRGDGGGGRAGSADSGVSPSTSSALDNAGPDGQALNQSIAPETTATPAPAKQQQQRPRRKDKGGAAGKTGSEGAVASAVDSGAPSNNPLRAVKAATTDGAVLGGPLVWVLLGITLAGGAVGLVRGRAKR